MKYELKIYLTLIKVPPVLTEKKTLQTKSLFLVLRIFSLVLTIYNQHKHLQLLTWFYLRIMT